MEKEKLLESDRGRGREGPGWAGRGPPLMGMKTRRFDACCLQLWAGQGPYTFSAACWLCHGDWPGCSLFGDNAVIQTPNLPPGTTNNVTTIVSVPGGGSYILSYKLTLGRGLQGLPTYFGPSLRLLMDPFPLLSRNRSSTPPAGFSMSAGRWGSAFQVGRASSG